MKISRNLWLLLLLLLISINSYSMRVGISTSKIYDYNIDSTGKLTSNLEISYLYNTDKSCHINEFNLFEKFYAPISKISAKVGLDKGRMKSVKANRMSWEYLESNSIFASDYKTHSIIIDGKKRKPGTRVKINANEEYNDLSFFPLHYITTDEDLDSLEVMVTYPIEYEVEFEIIFYGDTLNYEITKDDKSTKIKFDAVKSKNKLEWCSFSSYATIVTKIFKHGKLLTPNTPELLTKWYGEDLLWQTELDSCWQNLMQEEIEAAEDDYTKVKIINDYVKEKVRYIALHNSEHSFIPHEPNIVLEKMYGDCKDKALLVKSWAKIYGLNVDMVLISDVSYTGSEITHPTFYNHMICSWDNNGKTIFFDPTGKYNSFGYLSKCYTNQYALILSKEKPRYEFIEPNFETADIELTITTELDSLKKSRAEIVLHNDLYSYCSYAHEELTGIELENYISRILSSYFYKISLDYITYEKRGENSFYLTAVADMSEFIIESGNSEKRYITKTPFVVYDRDLIQRREDGFPLSFSNYNGNLSVVLSASNYTTEEVSSFIDYKGTTFFKSNSSVLDNGDLNLSYEFVQGDSNIDQENKSEFIDFVKKYFKSKKNMYILEEVK